jgi:hypothetical protein
LARATIHHTAHPIRPPFCRSSLSTFQDSEDGPAKLCLLHRTYLPHHIHHIAQSLERSGKPARHAYTEKREKTIGLADGVCPTDNNRRPTAKHKKKSRKRTHHERRPPQKACIGEIRRAGNGEDPSGITGLHPSLPPSPLVKGLFLNGSNYRTSSFERRGFWSLCSLVLAFSCLCVEGTLTFPPLPRPPPLSHLSLSLCWLGHSSF